MTKPDLTDVLAEVNRLRVEHSIGEPLTEMPKGGQHSDCCPIAKALTGNHGAGSVCAANWGFSGVLDSNYPMPPVLAQFVRGFDADAYPELIA